MTPKKMNLKFLLTGIFLTLLIVPMLYVGFNYYKYTQDPLANDLEMEEVIIMPTPVVSTQTIKVTITKADVACARMATRNGCSGDITYYINNPNDARTHSISLPEVYDNKTNEMDGALLYKVKEKPLSATLEFDEASSSIKKIYLSIN